MDLRPSARQQELITRARGLALERFAPRADTHDRDASFPFEDYADLRAEGLLALCVPERYGGLGADYETYCLVAEQLAQGNASTSLTFNMHCLTMLPPPPQLSAARRGRVAASCHRAAARLECRSPYVLGGPHSHVR